MEIMLDQADYVTRLRHRVHSQLRSGQPEDLCCLELQALYMSLLGAIAYLSHTRIDIVVFICAFQRHTQASGAACTEVEQTVVLDSEESLDVCLQELWEGEAGTFYPFTSHLGRSL